jgi:hypothetical protein
MTKYKVGDNLGQRFCFVCKVDTSHKLYFFGEVKCIACNTTNYTIPIDQISSS